MNNRDKAEQRLTKALGNTPLAKIAAEVTCFAWDHGYCEAIEHIELRELFKDLACPWCGKLHISKSHLRLSKVTEEQWEMARKSNSQYSHPINRLVELGFLTKEELED